MCFAPQRRALFRHRNFQKWSDHGVFCTFWLQNMLRATTACTFSTSQLQKWSDIGVFLYILTSKCASRHNGVHFFDISTSKSAPLVFRPFWLGNVLRATTACTFSMSHLASWLRTRRFSEPTFRPSGATNHWKNTVNRDFPIFSRIYLFFLLIFSLLTLFTSAFQLSILSEVSLLNFLRLSLLPTQDIEVINQQPQAAIGWLTQIGCAEWLEKTGELKTSSVENFWSHVSPDFELMKNAGKTLLCLFGQSTLMFCQIMSMDTIAISMDWCSATHDMIAVFFCHKRRWHIEHIRSNILSLIHLYSCRSMLLFVSFRRAHLATKTWSHVPQSWSILVNEKNMKQLFHQSIIAVVMLFKENKTLSSNVYHKWSYSIKRQLWLSAKSCFVNQIRKPN